MFSRRNMLKVLGLSFLGLFFPKKAKANPHKRAGQLAKIVQDSHVDVQSINSMSLDYDVRMDVDYSVPLRTSVKIDLSRNGNIYTSSMEIQKPVHFTLYGLIMMQALGGYRTKKYQNVVKGLNTRVVERFSLEHMFSTIDIEETILQRYSEEQSAIKLKFDKNNIYLWPDKTKEVVQTIENQGFSGPFTGFWNYGFFLPDETVLRLINPMKRALDNGGDRTFETKIRKETIHLKKTSKEYVMRSQGGNLLDLINGKTSYKLAKNTYYKIPIAANIDGVISRTRLFEKQMKGDNSPINNSDLAARDVKVYLRHFEYA